MKAQKRISLQINKEIYCVHSFFFSPYNNKLINMHCNQVYVCTEVGGTGWGCDCGCSSGQRLIQYTISFIIIPEWITASCGRRLAAHCSQLTAHSLRLSHGLTTMSLAITIKIYCCAAAHILCCQCVGLAFGWFCCLPFGCCCSYCCWNVVHTLFVCILLDFLLTCTFAWTKKTRGVHFAASEWLWQPAVVVLGWISSILSYLTEHLCEFLLWWWWCCLWRDMSCSSSYYMLSAELHLCHSYVIYAH